MKQSVTPRGFGLIDFRDANGKSCSVQQSSAIGDTDDAYERPGSSMLWLGTDETVSGRMHLSHQQVSKLVKVLNNWLETGSLGEGIE